MCEDNKKLKLENENKTILIDKYEIELGDYPSKLKEISILKRDKDYLQDELITLKNKNDVIYYIINII